MAEWVTITITATAEWAVVEWVTITATVAVARLRERARPAPMALTGLTGLTGLTAPMGPMELMGPTGPAEPMAATAPTELAATTGASAPAEPTARTASVDPMASAGPAELTLRTVPVRRARQTIPKVLAAAPRAALFQTHRAWVAPARQMSVLVAEAEGRWPSSASPATTPEWTSGDARLIAERLPIGNDTRRAHTALSLRLPKRPSLK